MEPEFVQKYLRNLAQPDARERFLRLLVAPARSLGRFMHRALGAIQTHGSNLCRALVPGDAHGPVMHRAVGTSNPTGHPLCHPLGDGHAHGYFLRYSMDHGHTNRFVVSHPLGHSFGLGCGVPGQNRSAASIAHMELPDTVVR